MKKNAKIIFTALLIYILLVVLLFAVEYRDGNTGIHSIWDAVWFSLITMTTVGYGDIAPVTAAGRLIGTVFALCSIGIFAALIGLGISLIGGQIIPRLRLRANKNRDWFVFAEENEDSLALAKSLSQSDMGLVIFLEGEKKEALPDAVWMNSGYERFLDQLRERKTASFFFMGEDPWLNYSRGLEAAQQGMQVYSMSSAKVDQLPENLHLFCREDALSRFYWQQHPLRRDEKCVVLIGCGLYGSALLERALGDSLFFHGESWTECRDLLRKADRIIICRESDQAGMSVFDTLKSWYVAPRAIHVRLSGDYSGITSFGERDKILTPEFVMKDLINRMAIRMNDLYNEGTQNPTPWNELSGFFRESNIAAADHLIVKVRYLLDDDELTSLTPEDCLRAYERYREQYAEKAELFEEMEHRRWMRFLQMYNWRYAPKRDNAQRLHLKLPETAPIERDIS